MLTERQITVCKLIAQGRADKDIACELGITIDGVRSHLRVLFKRARCRTRTGLVLWFFFLDNQNGANTRLEETLNGQPAKRRRRRA